MVTTLQGHTPAATYPQLGYLEPSPAANTANVRQDTGSSGQIILPLNLVAVGSQTAYLNVTGAAGAGGTVALAVAGTDTNPNLSIDAKGSGAITLAGISTGPIYFGQPFSKGTGQTTLLQVGAGGLS